MKRDLRVRYTVVGDGPQRRQLEKLAVELGVTRQVEFAGARSHDEVAKLLSRSDILLAPSVTAVDGDSEGTPVAIFEAGASSIPVISTFHSGIGEVVQDGVTGFLVSERDEQALANRIAQLAGDALLRTRMGDAGRKFVEANHNLERLNDDLAMLYLQVGGHANSV
jgi:colanic acid/amylovoran biosynthesis glycosyltransferase